MRKTGAPMAKATLPTTGNRTGAWRFERPVFVRRVAPCSRACPAGEDVAAVELAAGRGDWEAAALRIREENPFPAVCGRVCSHPCEASCNRAAFDEAVSIRAVERLCAERPLGPEPPDRPEHPGRVAVVGAGPAGLAASRFLARRGHAVDLFEAAEHPGGIPRHAIPGYRLPLDVLGTEVEAVLRELRAFHPGRRLGEDLSWGELTVFDAVFVATGAWSPAPLSAPGRELLGDGLELLRAARTGDVTASGPVAVIGGGNTALDVARVLRRAGAEPTVYYRRRREDLPAFREELEEAEEEGVVLRPLLDLHSIGRGAEGGLRLLFRPMAPAGLERGRARVEPSGAPPVEVWVTAAYAAAGFLPSPGTPEEALSASGSEELTPRLRRVRPVGPWAARPPVFVGGDAVSPVRTVATAIGAGKEAAVAVDAILRGSAPAGALAAAREVPDGPVSARRWLGSGRTATAARVVLPSELNPAWLPKATRRDRPALLPPRARVAGFEEVRRGLSRAAGAREARRCFHCGLCDGCDNCFAFCPDVSIRKGHAGERSVDYDYCKGCGICAEECPRGAVDWIPE